MNDPGVPVTFQCRKTYPVVEAGKMNGIVDMNVSKLHNQMKSNLNDRMLN